PAIHSVKVTLLSRTKLCRWSARLTSRVSVRCDGAFLAYSAKASVMLAGVRLRMACPPFPTRGPQSAGLSQERIVVGTQQREQQVIGPLAVDAQILARQALLAKADLVENRLGRLVVRQAGGLQAVQPEIVEDEGQDGAQAVGHQSLPGIGLAHPVSDRRGLGDAAADIADVDAAGQAAALVGENEQPVGLARPPFAGLLAQAAAEMIAPQGILRPGRFPGGEKSPAARPQFG